MHKVLLHNNNLDDVFFVTKFMQGLHPDIRSAIVLHKPRTVDVALSFALMQAEVLDPRAKLMAAIQAVISTSSKGRSLIMLHLVCTGGTTAG